MAQDRHKHDELDDMISRCGSISGETFVSLRSRRDCSTLRQHKTDLLARNLREYHARGSLAPSESFKQVESELAASCAGETKKRRFLNQSFHSYRFVVAMMGGASVGIMLALRYNITIAILRMVNQTHLYLEEHPNRTVEDFLEEGYVLGGEFNWNNEIVAIILSWYMFSYTLPQAFMAKLSSMLGCRLAVPLALSVCALSTMATPTFAYFGWEWVVACRLVGGIGAACVLPCLLGLIEAWMRYDEITVGLSVSQVLNSSLTAITPLITGYLTERHWSLAFYVPGLFTLAFCGLWLVMVTDEPGTNWLISERELNLICDCAHADDDADGAGCGGGGGGGSGANEKNPQGAAGKLAPKAQQYYESFKPDSWTQIFRVPSFYAYICVWICYCSSMSGFVFVLPAYMRQFLKIRITENGFYCFIIQLGCVLSVIWPQQLLALCARLGASPTRARIVAYAVCCSLASGTWIYVGLYHDSQLFMLFLNRAVHPCNDVIVTGCLMSNYAKAGLSGLAFAMVNTVGNLSIVGTSTFYGWLLDYTGASREGWCYIFLSLGGAQIVMFLIFATFISAGPIKFQNKVRPATVDDAHPHTPAGAAANTCASQQPVDACQLKRKLTAESSISDMDNLARLKKLAEPVRAES